MRVPIRDRQVVFFDGDCAFCRRSVARLQAWVPASQIEYQSFREPGSLDGFDGLSLEDCAQALQYVAPDGKVHAGLAGIVRLLMGRPLGLLATPYFIPGIRQVCDLAYRWVAHNRLRIGGVATCSDGACPSPTSDPQRGRASGDG